MNEPHRFVIAVSPSVLAAVGPTIRVHVGFDPKFKPRSSQKLSSQARDVPALIDTGAFVSCIDTELADKISLKPIDTTTISGAGGKHEKMPIFLAQIHIPDVSLIMHGEVVGVHLARGNQPHQAILGRNFLHRHIMVDDDDATNNNTFVYAITRDGDGIAHVVILTLPMIATSCVFALVVAHDATRDMQTTIAMMTFAFMCGVAFALGATRDNGRAQ